MNIGMAYYEFGGTKGIARAAGELASHIAARGHHLEFHCIQRHAEDSRIQFKKITALNSFTSFGIAMFAMMGKRSLERSRYDITHSHGNIIGTDIITAHSCHRAGMRVHKTENLGIADTLRLYIERKNYGEKRFKKIIAVAEGVKRELMGEYNVQDDDVVVIPNGVNLSQFSPRSREREEIRRQIGLSDDDCALLFVANEFGRKGLGLVLSSLSLLRKEHVYLLIAGGDGTEPYRAQARTLGVTDRVRFLGGVGDVEHYYTASDVFILPTFYEAFSLATLEAAASGLPLIVTKVNGTEELIEDRVNGFFVERDADDIADKLRQVVEDVELRRRLGVNARKSAERYSWDIVAERTLALYERVRR